MKNKHAQEMAKIRWSKTTKKERVAYSKMLVEAKRRKKEGLVKP